MAAETRNNRYTTLKAKNTFQLEVEIKRSRFLGYAKRVSSESEARNFINQLRKQHYSATHVCHGFVIGADREIQRSTDDGEPAGTAGIPILDTIVKRQTHPKLADLSDVCVVVVRYFGGIKLGAGGLVQAYSSTGAKTLDNSKFVTRLRTRLLALDVPYTIAGRLETSLRELGFHLQPTQYFATQATICMAIDDNPHALKQANTMIQSLTFGKSELVELGTDWVDKVT